MVRHSSESEAKTKSCQNIKKVFASLIKEQFTVQVL